MANLSNQMVGRVGNTDTDNNRNVIAERNQVSWKATDKAVSNIKETIKTPSNNSQSSIKQVPLKLLGRNS